MTHRAPEKIRALAEGLPSPTQLPSTTSGSTEDPPAADSAAVGEDASASGAKPASTLPVDFSQYQDVGLDSYVSKLGRDLNGLQDQLLNARRTGAARSVIKALQDDVNDALDLYSRCTAKLDEQRKRRGDLIDIAEVQDDWGMLLSALASMRERMVADVDQAVTLAISSARDPAGAPLPFSPEQLAFIKRTIYAAVLEVREREDRHLRSAKFWHDGHERSAA